MDKPQIKREVAIVFCYKPKRTIAFWGNKDFTVIDKAMTEILDLLQTGTLNQSTIVEQVDAGRHSVLDALKQLAKNGDIKECKSGREKLYELVR